MGSGDEFDSFLGVGVLSLDEHPIAAIISSIENNPANTTTRFSSDDVLFNTNLMIFC